MIRRLFDWFTNRKLKDREEKAMKAWAEEATRLDTEINDTPAVSGEERLRLLVKAAEGKGNRVAP